MTLMAGLPVLEDLAMKFHKHSIHDSFQLPNFYQYPANWQAKEFALYFQPSSLHGFASLDQATPFEFKASGNFTTKRNNRNKTLNERASVTRHSPKRQTEQVKINKSQILNPASDNKERKSNAVKTLDFADNSEDISSDDEELSCFFSNESEHFSNVQEEKVSCPTSSAAVEATRTRSLHNRKRSIEDEEYTVIKRCCRPRLNFDKMLLTSRASPESSFEEDDETTTNYFRPISPQDLL